MPETGLDHRIERALAFLSVIRATRTPRLDDASLAQLEEYLTGDYDGRGLPAPTLALFEKLLSEFVGGWLHEGWAKFPPYLFLDPRAPASSFDDVAPTGFARGVAS